MRDVPPDSPVDRTGRPGVSRRPPAARPAGFPEQAPYGPAWHGMPVFTFDGDLVRDLWVLGDIHGLIERPRGEASSEA